MADSPDRKNRPQYISVKPAGQKEGDEGGDEIKDWRANEGH